MAKYSNVFKEASRRMKDFRSRGFIPEGSKYVFQDFVQEVAAENRGETYHGAYTKEAYKNAYGVDVEYFDSTTYDDITNDREEKLVEYYKTEILSVYNFHDFYENSERWGNGNDDGVSFAASDVESATTLTELIAHARQATHVNVFLMRKKNGRNRKEESAMLEIWRDEFAANLMKIVDEMSEQEMKYKY